VSRPTEDPAKWHVRCGHRDGPLRCANELIYSALSTLWSEAQEAGWLLTRNPPDQFCPEHAVDAARRLVAMHNATYARDHKEIIP
jgi:hypothetical protein